MELIVTVTGTLCRKLTSFKMVVAWGVVVNIVTSTRKPRTNTSIWRRSEGYIFNRRSRRCVL